MSAALAAGSVKASWVTIDRICQEEADGIRLRCTVEGFGSLEPAEEMELVDNVIGGLYRPATTG